MTSVHQPLNAACVKGSKSQLHKIDDTYLYFSKNVDPIISPCVANFLFKQPRDIISALLSYFEHIKKGMGTEFFDDIECHDPKKNQKIYFTYNFGPIISKIIDMVAASQPADVVDYICSLLRNSDFVQLFGTGTNNNYGPEHETTVSTTRSKLNGAINLANSIRNPTPKVLQKPSPPSETSSIIEVPAVAPKEILPVLAPPPPIAVKNIQITLLGMGGGGKTSIINALQGRFEFRMKPSLGFKPTSMMLGENINVKFYDLGGGPKIRSIWSEYYHDVHALIYVFDSTLTGESLEESIALFRVTLEHPSLSGKPVLILSNKQDKEGAISSSKLSELLDTNDGNILKYSFADCSSFVSKECSLEFSHGDLPPNGPQSPRAIVPDDAMVDPRFETALEKFLDKIQENFSALNNRVSDDIETRKTEEIKKRLERERKVLKNKIALAFKDQIDPSLLPPNLPTANPEDTFTEEEGMRSPSPSSFIMSLLY